MFTRLPVTLFCLVCLSQIHAQEPTQVAADAEPILSKLIAKVESSKAVTTEFKTSEQVFSNGQIVFDQKTDYSSASALPNKFALRVHSDQVNAEIVSDGETMYLLVAPSAYIQKDSPKTLEEVTTETGMPSGPVIDTLLALTVAGNSARDRLLEGVTKVSVATESDLKTDEQPAVQVLRLEKADLSVLEIAVTLGEEAAITGMQVDMTELIKKSNPQVTQTPGFRFRVEVKVAKWDWKEGDKDTFKFVPPADSKAFASIEALVEAMQGGPHPTVGKQAPDFEAALMDDSKLTLSSHRDKQIVVLDFWATWCGPCRQAMPVIADVAKEFESKGVVLYAVNSGETKAEIQAFLTESKLPITVVRDEEQAIGGRYQVTGLPMTVLIGKDGTVETVHLGFQSLEGLREQLRSELQVLVEGGSLIEGEAEATKDAPAEGEEASQK